jgi:single-strand DNA-binding protein
MNRGLNRTMLIGNVGASPELRTTRGGVRLASFSLATSRRWTDDAARTHEKTEWHRVVAWDRLADLVGRVVRKGDRLYVEGRVEYRSWPDASGRTRHATEIIVEDLIPLDAPVVAALPMTDLEPPAGGSPFPTGDDLPF